MWTEAFGDCFDSHFHVFSKAFKLSLLRSHLRGVDFEGALTSEGRHKLTNTFMSSRSIITWQSPTSVNSFLSLWAMSPKKAWTELNWLHKSPWVFWIDQVESGVFLNVFILDNWNAISRNTYRFNLLVVINQDNIVSSARPPEWACWDLLSGCTSRRLGRWR